MWKKGIRLKIVLLVSFLLLMGGATFAATQEAASGLTKEQIIAQSKPSVVRILIEVKPADKELHQFYFSGARKIKEPIRAMAGTGIVVNENGYILTAYHVAYPLGQSPTLYVRLSGEGDFPAKIVADDKERQLACIKIDKSKLQPLAFASKPMERGNSAYAIGYPLAASLTDMDAESTFTSGEVSAIKRTRQEATFIQTNAAISLGNAGGPLLNERGHIGGIVVYSSDPSFASKYFNIYGSFKELFETSVSGAGIGFAVPATYAENMLTNAQIPFIVAPQSVIPPTPDHWYKKYWKELLLGIIIVILIIIVIAFLLSRRKRIPVAQAQQTATPSSSAPLGSKSTVLAFGSIKFTSGELAGKSFAVTANGLNIGRDGNNDVVLKTETVSRKHCWIGPSGSGMIVKDTGSTNGTYVNGVKIEGTKPVTVGDTVSLSKSGQEAFTISE